MARKGMHRSTAAVLVGATVAGITLAAWLTSGDASESYNISGGSVSSIAVDEPQSEDFGTVEPTDATSASDSRPDWKLPAGVPAPPSNCQTEDEGTIVAFEDGSVLIQQTGCAFDPDSGKWRHQR